GAPGATTRGLVGPAKPILATIIGALFVLICLVPVWRKRAALPPSRPARFVPAGDSVVGWAEDSNRALLAWTLQHRWIAALLSIAALCTIAIPFGNTSLTAFGEDEDTSELEFWIDLEDNFTLSEASDEMLRYERFVEEFRDEMGFKNVVARFDPGGGEIELRWPERIAPKLLEGYRDRIRKRVPAHAGHRVYFRGQDEISDSSKQFVTFELRGPDPDRLLELGDSAVDLLARVPGLADVKASTEDQPDQLLLELDGDTAFRFGVTSETALQNVGWALRGTQLPRYQEEDREVPMYIEYDDAIYAGVHTLEDLVVFGSERSVPLATFSELSYRPAPSRIVRRNGQITHSITARLADPTRQAELVEAGYDALESLDMPRGYALGRDDSVVVRGQQEMRDLQNAMLLSVVLVFLLMGILFESLLLPLSVLTTIPFAMLGALWTLYVTGTPMDSIGWIGIIILVGVVVNNGIVLIDKIHRLRKVDGRPRADAVVEGAAARVRPIVMTALTTVVGLLPMALGDAPTQGIDYRALSTCVAGGLAICTFFTLWVVPLTYTVVDDLSHTLGWLVRRSFAGRPRGAVGAGPVAAPLGRR
ncbi:MAG: efflux RND transporter permease subunit, partial [Planctomycetota bacterium]